MSPDVFADVGSGLAQEFRVNTVDLNPVSGDVTLDRLTDALIDLQMRDAIVCGWSLGGQIALNWAQRQPRSIARLVLIATTPRFVNGADWNHGMDDAVFDRFELDLHADAVETLARFALLQAHGDANAGGVARRLREKLTPAAGRNRAALNAGLRILRQADLRAHLHAIGQPALVIHGDRDSVVPLAAGAYLARELADAQLQVAAGAAHAPFVSNPRVVVEQIRAFCHG